MAASRTGNGYWLVAGDGGIFAFGDARFSGSTGNLALARPIVGMAADPDGVGHWFVAADGGVFAFDAAFAGSAVGRVDAGDRVVGMAAHPSGRGYWLATARGAVLAFGAAEPVAGTTSFGRTVAGIAAHPGGKGYWLAVRRRLESAPAPVLSARSGQVEGEFLASCWTRGPGEPGICADAFSANGPVLTVRRGETVSVRWHVPDDPTAVALEPPGAGLPRLVLEPANPTGFRADLPRGLHRYSVNTSWAPGSATHVVRLRVV